jgi:hypothetical protein
VTTTATNWNLAVSGSIAPERAVTRVMSTAAAVMTAAYGVGSSHVAKSTASKSIPPRVGLFGTASSMTRTNASMAMQPRNSVTRPTSGVGCRGLNASRRLIVAFMTAPRRRR